MVVLDYKGETFETLDESQTDMISIEEEGCFLGYGSNLKHYDTNNVYGGRMIQYCTIGPTVDGFYTRNRAA